MKFKYNWIKNLTLWESSWPDYLMKENTFYVYVTFPTFKDIRSYYIFVSIMIIFGRKMATKFIHIKIIATKKTEGTYIFWLTFFLLICFWF